MTTTATDHPLSDLIETYFEQRHTLIPGQTPEDLTRALMLILKDLNNGKLRIAEKIENTWHTHAWLKQAILLLFRTLPNQLMGDGITQFFDKVPLKYQAYTEVDFQQDGVRVVPPAYVRHGAYIAPNTVLMPSYVNSGAYIDSDCMIDTWATVGSCAQIGKRVHLSGGAGIGGVLEPIQANPTIIEDDCFIGARSEIVEGVIVEEGAVISMGVFIGQSTKIYDRAKKTISYGRVPAGAVVVPGALPAADGSHSLACAVIVKQVDSITRQKTAINELLRGD